MARTNLGRIRTVFKGEWVAGDYVIDDVVLYAGSAYTCIAIAAAGDDPTNTAFWVQSTGGIEFVGVWDTSTTYKVNQIVTFNGSTYIAITAHSSTEPTTSGQTDWDLIAGGFQFEGVWNTGTTYQISDIATFNGSTYISLTNHTGTQPTATGQTDWNVFSGGLNFLGAWLVSTTYHKNDVVTLDGSAYIAIDDQATSLAPVLAGNAGWVLFARGGDIADQSGNTGKILSTDGTDTSWIDQYVDPTPDQSGQANKVLKTDGSVTSWSNVGVTELGITDGSSGDFLSTDGSGTLSFVEPPSSGGGGTPAFSPGLVSGGAGAGGGRAEFPAGSPTPVGTGIMSNPTGTCKVCCDSFACGGGCDTYWTVPSGVTQVQWQVWGAGAGGAVGCCCGGGQYGANGAYVTTTMNVNAGDQYHVVAGCSCQIMCCSNNWAGYGCGSYVTGAGISCLCADGGCTQNCDVMNCERYHRGMSSCHKFQNFACTDSGPCYCSSGEYCFASSCATCGFVENHLNPARNGCVNISSSCNPTNSFTLGSYHGGGCLDTNNYGYHTQPPHIDETHVMSDSSNTTNWDGCFTFTSHGCIGGCACNCKNWKPGFGGYGSHVMGGYNTYKGSIGNGGMVKISWK